MGKTTRREERREKREEREADAESEEETEVVRLHARHHDHEPPRTDGIVCTVVVRGHVNNEHVRCRYTGWPYIHRL